MGSLGKGARSFVENTTWTKIRAGVCAMVPSALSGLDSVQSLATFRRKKGASEIVLTGGGLQAVWRNAQRERNDRNIL